MSQNPTNPGHDSGEGARILPFPHQRARRPTDQDAPAVEQPRPDAGASQPSTGAGEPNGSATVAETGPGATPGTGPTRSERDRSDVVDGTWPDGVEADWSRPDEAGDGARVLVDQPDQPVPVGPSSPPGLPPILPSWVKSRGEFVRQVRWQARRSYHRVAYHAVRLHVYAGRLAVRSPRGVARLVTSLVRWVFDLEAEPVRMQTVDKRDYEAYRRLVVLTSAHRRARLLVTLPFVVVGLVGLGLAWWALAAGLLAWWLPWLTLITSVLLLGVAGRRPDKPVVSPAVVPTRVSKLTAEVVVRALGALGIAEINKAITKHGVHGIPFPQPIATDGPGWRAEVDLPYGVTASEVIERRDKLASGLRRPIGCVWPDPVRDEHTGRLVLWVGHVDFKKQKPATWPLAKAGKASLFHPFPFGHDPRGRQVAMNLMFNNLLIGAMPRQGKTFSLRVVLLAAALDPTCEIHFADLKGTGDNDAVAQVAHSYACGAADQATLDTTMASIRTVHAMLEPRANTIQRLPKDLCPESKVTEDLARQRSRKLHPVVLAIDEIQELFESSYAEEAVNLLVPIIKRGPALGIMLVLSTQRPDADSLPKKISANMGIRFCLRVTGHVENDMVLGTGAHKRGLRATDFTIDDLGIGWLVGATAEPQVVRGDYIDGPAAEKICTRARAARIAAGTLSGYAAGDLQKENAPATDLLADLLAVWPDGKTKVWNESLIALLGELRPEMYGEWTPEQLTAAVKPYGITTGQVWGTDPDTDKGANRRGLIRNDIHDAIAKRDKKRGGGPSPNPG